ncbi:MAG: hypothetical protein OXC30_06805 [Alphaproteobacteria bacterium]|nr:hypothetical protein [Alphaproteobacteria bacterium]
MVIWQFLEKILKEIKDLQARKSRQKTILQKSLFGVVCDQTPKSTLGDRSFDIKKQHTRLLEYPIDVKDRSLNIRSCLDSFVSFLTVRTLVVIRVKPHLLIRPFKYSKR